MTPVTLECDHCGGDAFTSSDGYFQQDEGERCDECGCPGHVDIDPDDVDPNGLGPCWLSDEDGRCNDPGCDCNTVAAMKGGA